MATYRALLKNVRGLDQILDYIVTFKGYGRIFLPNLKIFIVLFPALSVTRQFFSH